MKKKKLFRIFDWFTAVACGVISLGYFSSLGYDSKIVGSFLVPAFEFIERIVGDNVANVLFSCSFFGSGFLLGWIIVWCLNQIDRKLGSPMTSKNNN